MKYNEYFLSFIKILMIELDLILISSRLSFFQLFQTSFSPPLSDYVVIVLITNHFILLWRIVVVLVREILFIFG